MFYFTDAPTLLRDLISFDAHAAAYGTIAALTATTFIFGGFMREQVCIYMCPWPRIQGAMMDDDTLTVGYREWRGEPRAKKRLEDTGDCIDCMACVNVCPMGIDIRDGQQMECITCALCIDACDDIMDKIGKPRGLIDYLALSDEPQERAGQAPKQVLKHILRPRTILYTALWSLIGFGLVFALFIRAEIDLTVAAVRNPTFITLSDGSIRNTYILRLRNKHGEPREFRLSLSSDEILRIDVEGAQTHIVTVAPDSSTQQRVYVTARPQDAAAQQDHTDLRFWVEDVISGERAFRDSSFDGKDTK